MSPDSQPATQRRLSALHPRFGGIFFDDYADDSAWMRETGWIHFPVLPDARRLTLRGEFRPFPDPRAAVRGPVGLEVSLDNRVVCLRPALPPGPFVIEIPLPDRAAPRAATLTCRLRGVGGSNALAWLGRVTAAWPLPRALHDRLQVCRRQNKNRQLRLARLEADGETVFDFGNRHAPYCPAYARAHVKLGLNIVGFLTADLGVGESARCAVRAAEAAGLPLALVPLKLNCKNPLGDATYAPRLQETNPHAVNLIHVDAPQSRDIAHHHGEDFLRGKYNIGYWAWELPEFPDAWTAYFQHYDEIWCPSDFVNSAIALKSPLPVLTMPHAISFARPAGNLRAKFNLPADRFLFLFVYDLNSYSERKNPRAVLEAFRQSSLAGRGAALVIKTHSVEGNEDALAALQEAARGLPDTTLLTGSLSRADLYALESACDCFVSLHRAEGFGLAVAESMFLGKPVIATNWSATAEFVNADNGAPVNFRLATLDRNHGPYAKGQTWADPDPAHAAWWMQKLFADAALRERLGANARRTIEEKFSPAVIGARYRRRLESIAGW